MISPAITPAPPQLPVAAAAVAAAVAAEAPGPGLATEPSVTPNASDLSSSASAAAEAFHPGSSAAVPDSPAAEAFHPDSPAAEALHPDSSAEAMPDPFEDAEALEALEQRITTLAARIHAATHRLLTLIAEFDRRQGWKLGGHRSCAHWLAYRTGIDLGTAREKVRTARALAGLPEVSASMARGDLSFSKVRALTRRATPENEGELVSLARTATTAELERVVRAVGRGSRADEAALERERYEGRKLSVFPDYDGMYVVRGRLPAEVGALLMRAVEAASDALYRQQGGGREAKAGVMPDDEARAEAARRRADALGLLAERALAAGFGQDADEGRPGCRCPEEKRGGPVGGSRAERYQVMLHVEAETLEAEGEGGRSELEDGTRVSAETSQRLTCDCGLVKVRHSSDGGILDVGRRRRTLPPALRRALEVRDGGCRFPGCASRFTEGHHVVHWADGGETSLANTLLLCRHHHRLVHEGGWTVRMRDSGQAVFINPRGRAHASGGG